MKKQFISNSTKTSMARFGVALLLLMNLNAASAHPVTKVSDPFVAIKYVGLSGQHAQFQVDLVNDNEEAYVLTVQAEDGAVLYREKIARKIFTKKFEWDNSETGSSKLVFTVTGEKSKKTQVFEANSEVRTIHDMVVTKL